MSPLTNSNEAWVKSTRSSGNGSCVEKTSACANMNDSKGRTRPALSFIGAEWAAFTASVEVAPLGVMATDVPPVISALPDPLSGDLVGWYRVRLTRFPPSPEQLAEWERLAGEHRRDSVESSLCRVCRLVFPCLLGTDARAALAAARGDPAEFDPDPLVRLSARVLAAQRAEEGFAALLLPLLADARRVVSTHRPVSGGLCPACRDQSQVDEPQTAWPCGLYRLAATVLRRSGLPRPAPEQSD